MTDFVTLGKIIGFFGVKGWVKVHSDTEPRENIVSYSQWWLGDGRKQNERQLIKVSNGKRSGKNVIAKLDGVDSREQAELYLGKEIAVKRSELPSLSRDEFYWNDLIGCDVETLQGVRIGPVKRLFETGANEVLVVEDLRVVEDFRVVEDLNVKKDAGSNAGNESGEVLIPWIRPSVINSIDITAKKIVVDWDPDF